ncbi:M23 family metallopeptidase [Candidatus Nomurabacteria bacterium]|nr:M23 family metallopeptidase [Candidatus Nomurabacteria bacterium]
METKNEYFLPIQLSKVTSTQTDSLAHVGDLAYSIDYDAPEGTAVLAALGGTVIFVKDDSSMGGDDQRFEDDANYIEILHENDEVSEYEHLLYKSAAVKVGDRVTAGQKIAEVGNTGWSECPHLHFMVFPKGQEYKTLMIRFVNGV